MEIIINNGRRVMINGTLSQINGKWYVNGREVNINELASSVEDNGNLVNITINVAEGSAIELLNIDNCKTITINGNCNCRRVKTTCGDIHVLGFVDGDVHTNMGSIECGNVSGDVSTNMGSVNMRRS